MKSSYAAKLKPQCIEQPGLPPFAAVSFLQKTGKSLHVFGAIAWLSVPRSSAARNIGLLTEKIMTSPMKGSVYRTLLNTPDCRYEVMN